MLSFTCTRSSVVLQYGMIVVVVRSHSVIKQRSCFFLEPSLARQPTRPLTLAKPNKVHWRLRDREFLERRLLKNVEDGVLQHPLHQLLAFRRAQHSQPAARFGVCFRVPGLGLTGRSCLRTKFAEERHSASGFFIKRLHTDDTRA